MNYAEARRVHEIYKARLARLRYEEAKRELISVQEAKEAVETLLSPINRMLNDIPSDLKTNHPETSQEAMRWLTEHIDSFKAGLQRRQWEKETDR